MADGLYDEGRLGGAQSRGDGEHAPEATIPGAPASVAAPVRKAAMDLAMPFYPVRRSWTTHQLLDPRMVNPAAYVQALSKEALSAAPDYADCAISAVRMGGGIALHMADDGLGPLMRSIRKAFSLADDVEVSLSAHPGMVAAASMDCLRLSHATRVVVDYGTSSGEEWAELGRPLDPTAMEVSRMVMGGRAQDGRGIRSGGREMDLAFVLWVGNPGQNERSGAASVEAALGFGATEMRLQRFLLDPRSDMAQARAKQSDSWLAQPRHTIPAGERLKGIRAAMEGRLRAEGFAEYLPGLWALPGHESAYELAAARGCEVLGFGLGAVTRFDGIEARNTCDVATYLRFSDDPTHCVANVRPLGDKQGR